jgi:hypothetical protein
MVVRVGGRRRLVLDHEHGVQLGAEPLVSEHPDADAAVGQQRRGHARRHLRCRGVAALAQPSHVHGRLVEPEEVLVPRITQVNVGHGGAVGPGRADEERVGAVVAE